MPVSDDAVTWIEHSLADERREAVRRSLDVRVSLGVCEHRCDAGFEQPDEALGERQRPADVRELDEEEARIAGEREPSDRRLVHRFERIEVYLAARQDLDRDVLVGNCLPDDLEGVLHPGWRDWVVRANVRRRCDDRHPLRDEDPGDRERVGERRCPVVEPGEHVAMEIDHCGGEPGERFTGVSETSLA